MRRARTVVRPIALAIALVGLAVTARAQSLFTSVEDGPRARSHRFDVLHIEAWVRFDTAKRMVIGRVQHRMRSLDPSLTSFWIDAGADMQIERLAVDGTPASFEHRGDTLQVQLPKARRFNDTFSLAIDYRVTPTKGLYFIAPDSLRPWKRRQIWTQGEDEDTRYWLPCYDSPNDRATSELHITIPAAWKAVSNGVLTDTRREGDGSVTWHYRQTRPHASYLIMLAAGDYLVTRDTTDGVPLEYWSYPEMPDRVKPTFGHTPAMMRYFTKVLGVSYPWHKYAEIFIADFMYGGMENTTATTLNDYALVDERARLDYNPDGLLAHEMAHQWYGDLVTIRSWGHLWLHESYATYLEACFNGAYYGEDVLAKEMFDNGRDALNTDRDSGRDPIALGKGFTNNIYDRGSRVLYMLNRLLGDSAFWAANHLFLTRHAYGNVETNDLKLAYEDATGMNLDWFFDEWIYKAGAPDFYVEKSRAGDHLELRVRQMQQRDSLTGLFRMPVPIEVHYADHIDRSTIWVSQADEAFRFPLSGEPTYVIFDAGDAMLKSVAFPRPEQELVAQMQAPRMIDRFLAVRAIMSDSTADRTAVVRRARALHDAFAAEPSPYVREEIIDRIAGMEPGLAADVVERGATDTAVDVRRAAADHSYVIIDRARRATLLRRMIRDRSYGVVSSALGMLAATDTVGLEPVLRELKGLRSRRDRLASGWLNAVAVGRFNMFADDVCDYTTPEFRDETRALAYFTLVKLTPTTPTVRAAILRGLPGKPSLMRAAAASAARAHMDAEMRASIERLRDASSGDDRTFFDKVLQ